MVCGGKKRRCTLQSPRLTHLTERTYGPDAQALEPVAWKPALTGVGSWVESGLEAGSQGGRRGAQTFAPVRWQPTLPPALTYCE